MKELRRNCERKKRIYEETWKKSRNGEVNEKIVKYQWNILEKKYRKERNTEEILKNLDEEEIAKKRWKLNK